MTNPTTDAERVNEGKSIEHLLDHFGIHGPARLAIIWRVRHLEAACEQNFRKHLRETIGDFEGL